MEIEASARVQPSVSGLALPGSAISRSPDQPRLPQLRDVRNAHGVLLASGPLVHSGEVRRPGGEVYCPLSRPADVWQDHKVQQTQADRLVAGAYNEIVKCQEFGAINAHLQVLDLVVRTQSNAAGEQRISQVYLVKVAHILEAVINRARDARPDLALTRSMAKLWMQEIERRVGRGELSANGAAFAIYHVGDLINDAHLASGCAALINQVLCPLVIEYMHARPATGEGVFGLAFCGAVRAFEVQQSDLGQRWESPSAVDRMVEGFDINGWNGPDALRSWNDRVLTMTAKYAEQHRWRLARQVHLDPVGNVLQQRLLALTRQTKVWLDQARLPERELWNEQLQRYRPIGGNRISGISRDQENLCFAVHYYRKWLSGQSTKVRELLQLAPVRHGQAAITDAQRDARDYAQVLVPPSASEVVEISLREPLQELAGPGADLEAIAVEEGHLRGAQDREHWRERAVHAANAWIQAGERDRRAQLQPAEREGWDAFVQIFYQLQRQLSEDPLSAERRQGYVDALQRYAVYLARPGT